MSRYFSVKCKRCGTVLETGIHQASTNRDLEKLKQCQQMRCPRCHFAASYNPNEFFLGK